MIDQVLFNLPLVSGLTGATPALFSPPPRSEAVGEESATANDTDKVDPVSIIEAIEFVDDLTYESHCVT